MRISSSSQALQQANSTKSVKKVISHVEKKVVANKDNDTVTISQQAKSAYEKQNQQSTTVKNLTVEKTTL